MPWCNNEQCGKKNLKKEDVVFDETTQRVLCVPCGEQVAELRPQVVDKTFFGIHYTSDQGLMAEAVIAGTRLQVTASNDQLRQMMSSARKALG